MKNSFLDSRKLNLKSAKRLIQIEKTREAIRQNLILRSEGLTYFAFPFGMAGDLPSPSDYDGDGRAEAAVFRPSDGAWFIQRSSEGISITNFGIESDIPVPAAFLP